MSQLFLDRFKEFVNIHYSDHNITTTDICSNLNCSISYLHEQLTHEYDYSIMRYVEYFRILKSIKLICKGEKKVYRKVGYNSSSVFSKSFLRVTGFNARFFSHYQFEDHRDIIETAINSATENPKKAIEIIIKDVSITSMLSKDKKTIKDKKTKQKDKKGQKDNLNLEIKKFLIIFIKKL